MIRPDPQSPSIIQNNLRRSTRTRLPCLQHHLGQRAIYEVDKDGMGANAYEAWIRAEKQKFTINRNLVGATQVEVKDKRLNSFGTLDVVTAAEKEKEKKLRKRKTKALMKKRRNERSN
ncbi:hypothetical protein Mgra_00001912 [Meloidogyne graminicola]|uniref:Uncharacterized protein n=1 Tax=Meloidogyne graminicola TaxID=189291 RepID=A0A8S9ZZU5_9BILA|nr:hypothetical protein Mgra_00001912 [Meloidogyne graminicola]